MQAIPASVEDHVQQDSPVNFTPVNETPPPKLVLWQGVALLTADCLGVGVLALPNDVRLLGYTMGLTFLILNLPINYYAGDLLSVMALQLEGGATSADFDLTLHEEADSDDEKELELPETFSRSSDSIDPERSLTMFHRHSKSLPSYGASSIPALSQVRSPPASFQDETLSDHTNVDEDHQVRVIQKTNDLIEISKAIFDSPRVTHLVVMIYYLNLFLVLGDYILVMGRAVSAMFLDQICLPMAGVIASLFMFAICQLRTMAHLGRNVSVASLLAMLVVLLQCLFHHRTNAVLLDTANQEESTDIWAKFSALASIGFAVGSQKLFLNIRNELQTKEDASKVLAGSLTTYGSAYVLVILLAGSSTYF